MRSIRSIVIIACTFTVSFLQPRKGCAQKRVLSVKVVLALIQSGQPQLQAYKERSTAMGYNVDLAQNTLVPNLTGGYQAGYATDNNITGMSYPGLLMPISRPVAAHRSNNVRPGTRPAAYLVLTTLTFRPPATA